LVLFLSSKLPDTKSAKGVAMLNTTENQRQIAPAYVGFQTFKTLIGQLRDTVLPNRIDRSVLRSFNGGTQNQLLAALRFLDLIGPDNRPNDAMKALVQASGDEEWKRALKEVLHTSYPEMFAFPLATASSSEFETRFKSAYRGEGETIRKGLTFFINAANESGIALSPHVLRNKKPRAPTSNSRKKTKLATKAPEPNASRPPEPQQVRIQQVSVLDQLLAKFPAFDPSWPDELKSKWFDDYERLLAMGDKK
jgi:Family of unknown function (DUF5343)